MTTEDINSVEYHQKWYNENMKLAEQKEKEYRDMFGYENTMSKLQAGRVAKMLNKTVNTKDKGVVTMKEYIKMRLADSDYAHENGFIYKKGSDKGLRLNKTQEAFTNWLKLNK
jgi:hypothetical protein